MLVESSITPPFPTLGRSTGALLQAHEELLGALSRTQEARQQGNEAMHLDVDLGAGACSVEGYMCVCYLLAAQA